MTICAAPKLPSGYELIADQDAIDAVAARAYLSDVYVLEEHRKRGLSKAMLAHLQNHPELGGLRFWALLTHDAQSLYAQFGWKEYQHPERFMTLEFPDAHQ